MEDVTRETARLVAALLTEPDFGADFTLLVAEDAFARVLPAEDFAAFDALGLLSTFAARRVVVLLGDFLVAISRSHNV